MGEICVVSRSAIESAKEESIATARYSEETAGTWGDTATVNEVFSQLWV